VAVSVNVYETALCVWLAGTGAVTATLPSVQSEVCGNPARVGVTESEHAAPFSTEPRSSTLPPPAGNVDALELNAVMMGAAAGATVTVTTPRAELLPDAAKTLIEYDSAECVVLGGIGTA
jgi:hypothetical protein